MAITFPVTPPSTPGFKRLVFRMRVITGITVSQFSGEQQVFGHQGESWEAEAALPPMKRADAEAWISFLLSVRGMQGSFFLGDRGGKTPRGNPSAVTVNGAHSARSTTLVLSGSGDLKAGDYLQVGAGVTQRLYKVLADLALPGTADIFPRLREALSSGAAVATSNTKGVFRLAKNDVAWDLDEALIYGIGFSAIEAI